MSYGGDYQLTSNGDLAVTQDTPYNPSATQQRVVFLILTNPALPNSLGNNTSTPDDMFNPAYGSGARAYVGRNTSVANLGAFERAIQSGALDPAILQSPRPVITITTDSTGDVFASVSFTTITGQEVTIPDIPLTGANAI